MQRCGGSRISEARANDIPEVGTGACRCPKGGGPPSHEGTRDTAEDRTANDARVADQVTSSMAVQANARGILEPIPERHRSTLQRKRAERQSPAHQAMRQYTSYHCDLIP